MAAVLCVAGEEEIGIIRLQKIGGGMCVNRAVLVVALYALVIITCYGV